MRKVPVDKPIALTHLKWKKNTESQDYFGALQVVLSSGAPSEVFHGKTQNEDDLESVEVNTSQIRQIKGTKQGNWLNSIAFLNAAGTETAKIEATAPPLHSTQNLREGEEIIGVYGAVGDHEKGFFHNLGFIVWKAPQI